MDTRNDQASKSKVLDLISDIRVAQMVTIDPEGKLRSRPMVAQAKQGDNELWFFTPATSGKVHEIAAHHEVLLNYSDPHDQTYVAILGNAEVMHDRSKVHELWSEPMRVWFPKGADDPEIALIRVHVREADYWDSPSSTLVHVYGYAKAVLTGAPPNPGENRHVEFDKAGA